jgi:hypothetical protein
MHKGITVEQICKVNAAFHQADIATAWMTFIDHPLESPEQMLATLRLIAAQGKRVDMFIVGRFGLTSGSEIAACPERYGIRQVYYCRGDDFRLFPLFTAAAPQSPQALELAEHEIANLSATYYLDHYPWAGAISTHHSLLYLLKFGPQVFKQMRHVRSAPAARGRRGRVPQGLTAREAFAWQRMPMAQARFMETLWRRGLKAGRDGKARLSAAYFEAEALKRPPLRRDGASGR